MAPGCPRPRRRPRAAAAAVFLLLALVPAAACSSADGAGTARPSPAGQTQQTGQPGQQPRATDTADGGGDRPVDTAALPDSLTGQKPDWKACDNPDPTQGDDSLTPYALPDGTKWQCATLTVPRDYAEPGGATLGLALIRARAATQGERRLGSLLFNFGGPGGSGVATLPAFGKEYEQLHQRYDLVSFDPRGVGESEGLVCMDGEELDAYFAADSTPRTDAQEQEYRQRLRDFARACEEAAGGLLPHLTTENTARDLDLMRRVLGDRRLHYFGVSYGTQLGAVYAHLFPQRVGREVLDAVVDPTLTPAESALGQAQGFDQALDAYLEFCLDRDEGCPLGDTPAGARRTLTGFLERLRDHPLPATQIPGDRELTAALAWGGIAQALYGQDFWPYLTQGLEEALSAEKEDGTTLLVLSDALNGRNQDGTYTTLQSSLTAINCADTSARYDTENVTALLPKFRKASPVFGEGLAWSLLSCTPWPARGDHPRPRVGAGNIATPVLLVATTGDPATPYEGARAMQRAMGGDEAAVLLTYEGEGHGAYHSGDPCITDAVNAYLLDGEVPEDGATCGG